MRFGLLDASALGLKKRYFLNIWKKINAVFDFPARATSLWYTIRMWLGFKGSQPKSFGLIYIRSVEGIEKRLPGI